MTDLYIQFRHTRPQHSSAEIGAVISVYETNEIVEPPSGYLSWVKITGLPNTQNKGKLKTLLASPIYLQVGDNDPIEEDTRKSCLFDFENLPTPFKAEFEATRSCDIPLGVAISLLTNRKLNRPMVRGDFD